ncbi:MAG: AAA family ATPase, partial [Chloroflexi bacterium]|nr:AAA family ATPase [Chloroflexota bacterium]
MTGSGKTALARAMVASLVISNHQGAIQLAMIDLKRRGFGVFEGLPHLLCPVAASLEEAVVVLRMLIKEMERRDRAGIIAPRIVLFVDELAELMMQGGKEVEEALTRLMQRGREAGIHLVACTQKPLAGVIGSLVKANFPARVVGKVASAEDARVAAGISDSGAEQLKGKGEFVVIAGGSQVRVQGAWISEEEIRKLVRLLQASRNWRGSRSEYSRRCRVALAACAPK